VTNQDNPPPPAADYIAHLQTGSKPTTRPFSTKAS